MIELIPFSPGADLMLWAHTIASVALVLTCWWLCHENAFAHPPGRIIAAGYFVVGLSVLFTAFLRFGGEERDIFIIISKVGLVVTFIATSIRRHRMNPPDKARRRAR